MTRIGLTLNEAKTSIRQARTGAVRLSGIYVRAASLSEGWPLVSGSEPVEEERVTVKAESGRSAGAEQRRDLGRGARSPQSDSERVVCILQLRKPAAGVSGGRSITSTSAFGDFLTEAS